MGKQRKRLTHRQKVRMSKKTGMNLKGKCDTDILKIVERTAKKEILGKNGKNRNI